MNNPKKLFGLILTGGFSKRMGHDKALLNYHGKPQVEHVFGLLSMYCSHVFLSKRKDQSTYKDFPFIDDDSSFQGGGPLIGILSAMKAYPDASFFVMACDLPFVSSDTLKYILDNRDMNKYATAFKSSSDGLPEPLCAIWEDKFYKRILELFNQGIHCPRKILIKSDVQLLNLLDQSWLDNVNEPSELNDTLKRLKK